MKHARLAAVAAIFAVGVVATLTYSNWPGGGTVTVLSHPATKIVPSAINLAQEGGTMAAPPVAAAPQPTPANKMPAPIPSQVASALFAKLASPQASAADHRKAYAMAANCMRENGPKGVRLIMLPCDLPPGTWFDPEVRKRLVRECAEAGDCWSEMFNEGPNGHYPVFTADEFKPLEETARAKAVEKGDPFALRYEATVLRLKAADRAGTPEASEMIGKALAFDIASAANLAYLNGAERFSPKTDANLLARIASYPIAPTPEQMVAATTEARRLAAVFQKAQQAS